MAFGDIRLNIEDSNDGTCRCHGVKSPVHSSNGDIARVTDPLECIYQRISIWKGTKKGERPLNPKLGCCIYDFICEPMTYSKLLDLKGQITRELSEVFPEFRVSNVRVEVLARGEVRISANIGNNEVEFLGNAAEINALRSQLQTALKDLGMAKI